MKTAEELYKEMVLGKESGLVAYKDANYIIRFSDFKQTLAEHDKEIIELIDQEIQRYEPITSEQTNEYRKIDWSNFDKIAVLNELKQLLRSVG